GAEPLRRWDKRDFARLSDGRVRRYTHHSSGRGCTMEQTLELKPGDRRLAVDRLRDFIVSSVDAAVASDAPFTHLVFERVFPDDIYALMLGNRREVADYRPMHGRSRGHDLADGPHPRVKIDFFPEYIRPLPPQKRVLWDMVGRALCTRAVKEAFIRR